MIHILQNPRATGDDTRSLCTTSCKWTYLGHAHMQSVNQKDSRNMEACGWDDDFWEEIGLGDLVEGNHAKIGNSQMYFHQRLLAIYELSCTFMLLTTFEGD